VTALLEAIAGWAARSPERIAIDQVDAPPIAYAALPGRVAEMARCLRPLHAEGTVVSLKVDHGADVAVLELALLEAAVPVLSIPSFFTESQARHALAQAGAQGVYEGPLHRSPVEDASPPVDLPRGTARISFTSGSTGQATGICLSADHMLGVAERIASRLGSQHAGRHCALLPPGILLETVAGFFATLFAGGTYVCPSQKLAGLGDPFRPDFALMARNLAAWRITSLILVPEYLAGLVKVLEASGERLPHLTLVAVGGARVPVPLLDRAEAVGLPVLQGYGLTECASVVSLQEWGDPPGCVGRPLDHMQASVATDGEILLEGPLCIGTLDGKPQGRSLATGDLGRIDDAGRLWIDGRKSNLIVTSFGRNVSPEWVEEALLAQPAVAQAMVYGDGGPFPRALLVPASPAADLASAVVAANALLPAYAQVADWREVAHFTPQNGLLTGNGRLRRREIAARHLERKPDFFTLLEDATVRQRMAFLAVPQVRAGLAGTIGLSTYLAYLGQAYHHVRHTVPLMCETRARVSGRPELLAALDEYIAEETGHEEWILSDIAAAGGDATRARNSDAHPATQAMVDHAYARIRSGDPLAFFGMVYVLESVSVALASQGASAVAQRLGLPPAAFTYLTSHGALDQSHLRFFAELVNGLQDEAERQSIVTMAQEVFGLFGAMFAAIEMEPVHAIA
jgi:long-subunit acyl-CoA synthetase (AMP-forming)/pyrroloquinoline quinone (PQQ) biosynthesis protein C